MLETAVCFRYYQHTNENGYAPKDAIALIGVQYGLSYSEIVHILSK